MHRKNGPAEALAQRERFVESAMERREDPGLLTGPERYVAPRRIPAR